MIAKDEMAIEIDETETETETETRTWEEQMQKHNFVSVVVSLKKTRRLLLRRAAANCATFIAVGLKVRVKS